MRGLRTPVEARSRRRALRQAGPIVAVAVTAALALGGCTAGTSATTNGVTPISLFGSDRPGVQDMNTNAFTKEMEKKFGIKFSFQNVNLADLNQKQPVLLASGDYPDVIFNGGLSTTDQLKYGGQGVLVDLKPLLKKDAPNAWKEIQSTPGLEASITAPDGKIYALPHNNYCLHCNWTYQDWISLKALDKFGLSMPKTTADFEHVLSVFQANGMVPLTGATDGYAMDPVTFLMNAFIPFSGTVTNGGGGSGFLNVVDGKVQMAATQDAWKDGLSYLNGLYKNGYFSSSALTQNLTQAQQAISQGKVGVIPSGAVAASLPASMAGDVTDWMPIPALTGPDGVQSAAFTGQPAQAVFAITNKASEDAKTKIMQFLNYVWTPEGTMNLNFGPKGGFWDDAPAGSKGLVDKPGLFTNDAAKVNGGSVQNEAWAQYGPFDTNKVVRTQTVGINPFEKGGAEAYLQLTSQVAVAGHQAPQQYPSYSWVPADQLQNYATETTNINSFIVQNAEAFITGAKSLDKDWDSYLSGLDKLGLKDYLSVSQKAMTTPFDATSDDLKPDAANIKFLICKGPVPELNKKYLIQSGVPESDFDCK